MRALTLAILLLATPALADVTGPARVIDGDSLEVAGERIRLHGIDAPEMNTRDGWYARAQLDIIVSPSKPVRCTVFDKDTHGRPVALCQSKTANVDLGQYMIRMGWETPPAARGTKLSPPSRRIQTPSIRSSL